MWDLNDLLSWCRPRLVADARHQLGPSYANFGSDLVQDTLLEAHDKVERVRALKREQVLAWLRTVLARKIRHAWRDCRRTKRDVGRERPLGEVETEALAVTGSPPVEQAELAERIERAIKGLSREQQLAVILRCFCHWPVARVAECLGVEPSSVCRLFGRGMRRLSKSGLLSPDDLT